MGTTYADEHLRGPGADLSVRDGGGLDIGQRESPFERFMEFAETWDGRYPAYVKLWEDVWTEFVPFLTFDTEVRRVICSTDAIESVNARIRRAVKAQAAFRTSRPR